MRTHLLMTVAAIGLGLGLALVSQTTTAQVANHVPVKTGYEIKGCTRYLLESGNRVRQVCETWHLFVHPQSQPAAGGDGAGGQGPPGK